MVPASEVSPNGHEPGRASSAVGVSDAASSRKPTQSELLIGYVEAAELFHDSGGDGYATVGAEGHVENWPLKSERFRQWLLGRFYGDTGKAPSA